MGEIKLLPKNISDKIAAGEVVERPASIVKELIENAIDAKASAVSVNIYGGGTKEISVTDNGIGIRAEDIKLAFQKHATSKIFTLNDLGYISTQGFRGEALSSIAAVSITDMKTKRAAEETGTHIRVSGGRVDRIGPAGLPDGTSVTVSSLFYNVPARRKFLKSDTKEASFVSDLVSRYILAFPEISFHYTSEGKTIYHSSGNGDLKSSIYCVYGNRIADTIVYVEHSVNDIKVSGFVSRPGTIMKSRRGGSVFVNRRYVRNTALKDIIKSAYGETIVRGETPFFVLNIELPLSEVDVNVHPNKLQVRFKDMAAVEYVIKEAVSKVCKEVKGSVIIEQNGPEKNNEVEMHIPEGLQTEFFSGFARQALSPRKYSAGGAALKVEETESAPQANEYEVIEDDISEPVTQKNDGNESITVKAFRIIGSFGNTYVLVEQGDNLLIIDQHAAHERLLYEKYKKGALPAAQRLLEPCVITVSHEQRLLIDENIEVFTSAGFDIEPFGAMEYKINAVPSVAGITAAEELLNDSLNEIQSGRDFVLKRDCVIRAACRSAVKAGNKLNEMELNSLVESFLLTDTVPTCPHGRPVISVISKKQIEKSFKRVI
jgi:DNA mismatch repair protein MutL